MPRTFYASYNFIGNQTGKSKFIFDVIILNRVDQFCDTIFEKTHFLSVNQPPNIRAIVYNYVYEINRQPKRLISCLNVRSYAILILYSNDSPTKFELESQNMLDHLA